MSKFSGTVENDAIVIDGKDLSIGAVACVSRIRNPVQLARLVLNHSDHCVLSGDGAHQFAEQHRVPLIDNRSLVHERAKARLAKCASFAQTIQSSMSNGGATNGSCAQEMMAIQANGTECTANGSAHKAIICDEHDTVGAVAVDANGNLACATSTGGLTGKAVGRIGDSPLAGSGGWAENEVCAISTTGHGELIMRVALSKHIAMLRGQCGLTLAEAVDSGLKYMSNRVGGGAGVAALDAEAQPVIQHSTPHMVWACADSERKQITYGISQHDRQITSLDVNQS